MLIGGIFGPMTDRSSVGIHVILEKAQGTGLPNKLDISPDVHPVQLLDSVQTVHVQRPHRKAHGWRRRNFCLMVDACFVWMMLKAGDAGEKCS